MSTRGDLRALVNDPRPCTSGPARFCMRSCCRPSIHSAASTSYPRSSRKTHWRAEGLGHLNYVLPWAWMCPNSRQLGALFRSRLRLAFSVSIFITGHHGIFVGQDRDENCEHIMRTVEGLVLASSVDVFSGACTSSPRSGESMTSTAPQRPFPLPSPSRPSRLCSTGRPQTRHSQKQNQRC